MKRHQKLKLFLTFLLLALILPNTTIAKTFYGFTCLDGFGDWANGDDPITGPLYSDLYFEVENSSSDIWTYTYQTGVINSELNR